MSSTQSPVETPKPHWSGRNLSALVSMSNVSRYAASFGNSTACGKSHFWRHLTWCRCGWSTADDSFSFLSDQFNEQLISPKEFVCLAGKSTLKDWKRAIRLNGTMLRSAHIKSYMLLLDTKPTASFLFSKIFFYCMLRGKFNILVKIRFITHKKKFIFELDILSKKCFIKRRDFLTTMMPPSWLKELQKCQQTCWQLRL